MKTQGFTFLSVVLVTLYFGIEIGLKHELDISALVGAAKSSFSSPQMVLKLILYLMANYSIKIFFEKCHLKKPIRIKHINDK